jgi:hypothetical protein
MYLNLIDVFLYYPIMSSSLYTLVLPLRIMPYTDGRAWARREGYERHHGVRQGDELTDDDDDTS